MIRLSKKVGPFLRHLDLFSLGEIGDKIVFSKLQPPDAKNLVEVGLRYFLISRMNKFIDTFFNIRRMLSPVLFNSWKLVDIFKKNNRGFKPVLI